MIVQFDPNGSPTALAVSSMTPLLSSCFLFGGFDLEIIVASLDLGPEIGEALRSTYSSSANVSNTESAGEEWLICVGNGRTDSLDQRCLLFWTADLLSNSDLCSFLDLFADPSPQLWGGGGVSHRRWRGCCSEATCPSPTDSYEWPEALQSNRDGVYNATIVLSAGGLWPGSL
jgi:hypothetical protein